jgi:hypothetical protein
LTLEAFLDNSRPSAVRYSARESRMVETREQGWMQRLDAYETDADDAGDVDADETDAEAGCR